MNLAYCVLLFHAAAIFTADDATRVLVKVNGKAITAGDVEFAATTQHVKPEERAAREPLLVERLIERQLVRDFLAGRKIAATTKSNNAKETAVASPCEYNRIIHQSIRSARRSVSALTMGAWRRSAI